MLYADVEEKMAEPRKKAAEEHKAMDLERNLYNIVVQGREGVKQHETVDSYIDDKIERFQKQDEQLGYCSI